MYRDQCPLFPGIKTTMLLMLLLGSLPICSMSLKTRSHRGSNIKDAFLRGKQPVDKPQDEKQTVDKPQDDSPPPSFAILLTMYNSPEREGLYAKRLRWWLHNTDLPVFVVDSANHDFPIEMKEIRPFKELHFDQRQFLPHWNETMDGASTVAELASLDRAWNAFGKLWSEKFDYIIKVTAKYVLPDLTNAMHLMHHGDEFIFQDNSFDLDSNSPWVGTECLGFNSKHMGLLLQLLHKQPGYLEARVAAVAKARELTYEQLPPLLIPEEFMTQRGAGDVLWSVIQKRVVSKALSGNLTSHEY